MRTRARRRASSTSSRGFLLAFGGIALFVGAFVIANSLSITIAQRTREFATLRTIGASRRQMMRAVLLEALVIGRGRLAGGVALGLGLAKGLFWLFEQVGFTLPNSGLLLQTRTVIVALIVGVLVTVIASMRPARRATRVPPIAAVREGAALPPGRFARYRPLGSALLGLAGFALLAYGLFGSGLSTTGILLAMGVGCRAHLLRRRVLLRTARDAAVARARRPGSEVRRRSGDPRARKRACGTPSARRRRRPLS